MLAWKRNSNEPSGSDKTLGLEWTMNGLRKPLRKKVRSKKIEKNSKT